MIMKTPPIKVAYNIIIPTKFTVNSREVREPFASREAKDFLSEARGRVWNEIESFN